MAKKILIIDDEPNIVMVVTSRLKAAGYEVVNAVDGKEGLEKAKKEMPDLIILDLMLPKIDGYTVCRMLKFDANFKQIPVIMFTARAQAADKQTGTHVGADAYITKPFEPQTLMGEIRRLLKE